LESNVVFATARDPPSALKLNALALSSEVKAKLHIIQLDQSSESSIEDAAKEVGEILGPDGALDYLLNNAGQVSH
jgi:NAD(P)-dependent dehydrogenase (short-subunit alcohol dehydrogenase family)